MEGLFEACEEEIKPVLELARDVRGLAYCPYSNFHVGSAVLCKDGTVFTGVNVENASYGLSICAERVALTKAVSDGHKDFQAIAVCCDVTTDSFKSPCGACRQFIIEFGGHIVLYLVKPDLSWKRITALELLPLAFTPDCLIETKQQP